MAYGGADRRVPIYHGRKFYDAVKATNPNLEPGREIFRKEHRQAMSGRCANLE
jgi:hypothetical protein